MVRDLRLDRLREAVAKAGGPALVASRARVPIGTLNGYLAGGEMKLEPARRIAQACAVTLDWLAGSEASLPRDLLASVDVHRLARAMDFVDTAYVRRATKPGSCERAWSTILAYDLLAAEAGL